MKTLGLIALIMLLGCVEKNEAKDFKTSKKPSWVPITEREYPSLGFIYKRLYMVKLEDGTQCVVFSGYRAGGIDCNWAENKPKNP